MNLKNWGCMENHNKISSESKTSISQRIKAARSIAGYAERKAFCLKFNFPIATLEAWERGKNPLTQKGAKRLVEILRNLGIYCSEEWLIKGVGISPRPLQEMSEGGGASSSIGSLSNNLKIAREISTFITLNKEASVTIMRDDAMLPFYEKGDYVGGIKKKGTHLVEAINKRCIIELANGKTIVRQLYQGADPKTFNVSAINLNTKSQPIAQHNVEIISAAPIVWHRTVST